MAHIKIIADVTGKVWKLQMSEGTQIMEEDSILIVESMKMEIPVVSTGNGRLIKILVKEGDSVEDGQVVAVIET